MLKKYILVLMASLFLILGSISAEACGCSATPSDTPNSTSSM